jgi:hypothetical protein
MDSDGAGENTRQPWQSRILPAMLFALGALIVGYSSFSSSPTLTPTQTPTLQQALALASPTARAAVTEVAPREGPPNATPTQTPTPAPTSPTATPAVPEEAPREGPPGSTPIQDPASTYRVIPGDTLTGIAAKLNVPVNQQALWLEETICLNYIVYADRLISGQELRLPTPGFQGVVQPPIEKPLIAAPTQVSQRPTPRPPAPKTPSPTATPMKTPSRPGTPTTTLTPRPATIQKTPSRQN